MMNINVKLKSLMGKMDKILARKIVEDSRHDNLYKDWCLKNPEPNKDNIMASFVHSQQVLFTLINGFPEVDYRYATLYAILSPYEGLDIDESATIGIESRLYQAWLEL